MPKSQNEYYEYIGASEAFLRRMSAENGDKCREIEARGKLTREQVIQAIATARKNVLPVYQVETR